MADIKSSPELHNPTAPVDFTDFSTGSPLSLSTAEQVIILDIKIRVLILYISILRSLLTYPKADRPQLRTLCGYVVYTCKMPAIMEGFKKIRVASNLCSFKVNDWINDCICNLNLIFCRWNKDLRCSLFFCKPQNDSWVGGWHFPLFCPSHFWQNLSKLHLAKNCLDFGNRLLEVQNMSRL